MGIFFVIGAIHAPGRRGRIVYSILVSLGGLAGIAIAWRHVWLQSLPPDQVPDCGRVFS